MTITSTAPATRAHGTTANGADLRPGNGRTVIRELRALDAAERHQAASTASTASTGSGGFAAEQIAALAAPLDRSRISTREQGRGKVPYLQGWVVIAEANRIFGFDGWQRQTLFSRCAAQAERSIGRDHKPGWGVTYIARVRITVHAGAHGPLIREGTGAGHGIDTDLGLAHESAIKEAETDAMKRALVTFGNPFGLALYDKSQRQVSGSPAQGQTQGQAQSQGQARAITAPPAQRPPAQRPTGPRPTGPRPPGPKPPAPAVPEQAGPAPIAPEQTAPAPAAPAPEAAPLHCPLDPPTIRSLHERIRGLLPPQLAAFSQAFRRAFQVPAEIPSIAGLITEQRHRVWIQQYLAQGLGQGLGQAQARTA
jgi:hypothetical protein